MHIMVLGADGYIGWPLVQHLRAAGHRVIAVDSGVKRRWERVYGGAPVLPLPSFAARCRAQEGLEAFHIDLQTQQRELYELLDETMPGTIIHLAEQPSAPLSMLNRSAGLMTIGNNVMGTMNLIYAIGHLARRFSYMPHIIKLGSMGEYGTPAIKISEGILDCCEAAKAANMQFPKKPGSFYHASKVADSTNLEFVCRAWGFRVTDINQGIVWGLETDTSNPEYKESRTGFHADELFGTVFNRFIFQAVTKHPLTVYGAGGQTRGFLALQDVMRALTLVAENPPERGEFRVINQMTETWSVRSIAHMVAMTLGAEVQHYNNPRVEDEKHTYQVQFDWLRENGLDDPIPLTPAAIKRIAVLLRNSPRALSRAARILRQAPVTRWRQVPMEQEGSGI